MGKGHNRTEILNSIEIAQDIVLTKFKIRIPPEKWLNVVTRNFPNLSFLILSLMPFNNDLGNCLLKIQGTNLERDFLTIHDGLKTIEFEILGKTSKFILLNIKMRDPWILQTIKKYQVMIHYPLVVQKGKIEFQLISPRKKMDSLFTAFERKEIEFEIREMGKYKPKFLLTRRQDEIIRIAFNSGYFEIPRQINLTKLASNLNISPSALSENFRRIEKKLAQKYMLSD